MGFGWLLSMQPYGELWRRGRKLLHGHVHQGVTPQYQPVQLESARRFIREILLAKTDKEALPHAIKSNFGRSIIRIVYGIDANSDDSEYISLPNQVLENISEASTPGRFLVDFLPIRTCSLSTCTCLNITADDVVLSQVCSLVVPWCRLPTLCRKGSRVPSSYARQANRCGHGRNGAFMVLFSYCIATSAHAPHFTQANGTAPRSMSRAMLEEDAALPPAQSQYDLIKDVTGIAYLGGSDTTAAAIVSFFLAMLVYPDVQAKAQAEVDRVIGKDRLPEFDDMESMPYVQCVASECLRWLPVLPLCEQNALWAIDML
jgi:cytochrome P450